MQRFSTCGINVKFEINSKGIRQHRRNKMRIKMRKNEYLVQHKAIFLEEGGYCHFLGRMGDWRWIECISKTMTHRCRCEKSGMRGRLKM